MFKHHVLHIVFFVVVFGAFSNESFAQKKLKTYEDSVKYDAQIVQFNEWFVQANLEKNKKNYDQALALYYDCLKIKPKSHAVYYEMAQIFEAKNNYTEAQTSIEKALKYNRENQDYIRFSKELDEKLGKNQ
mgnify:CR=1 FL=1